MHKLALILFSALWLASSSAFAASYQQIDGTIVDPIQLVGGGDHPHSGSNLEPGAVLFGADLSNANLTGADLSNATLALASLTGATLAGATLAGADLLAADLSGADLTGANLTNAFGLPTTGGNASTTGGTAFYDINTDFTGTGFDPVAAGWTLVPEPSTALLIGLGLASLAKRASRN
jgi:hypothetical protein